MPRVSMFTVAKQAGTSTGTVSRVLNGGYVKADTRRRVVDVMRRLNYTPKSAANRTRRICVFIPWIGSLGNGYHGGIMLGLSEVLCGPDIQLIHTSFEDLSPKQQVQRVREMRTDVLMCIGEMPDEFLALSDELKGLIQINNWEHADPRCAYVSYDSEAAMKLAISHLADHGHRRVALLYSGEGSPGQRNCRRGYDRYMRKYLPNEQLCHLAAKGAEGVQQVLAEMMQTPNRPTALLLTRSLQVLPFYQAMAFGGCSIPGDLSMISDEHCEMSRYLTPPATTYGFDSVLLGRTAGEMACQLLNDPDCRPRNRKIKPSLTARASVAAPFDAP